jgi:hypothetical protein
MRKGVIILKSILIYNNIIFIYYYNIISILYIITIYIIILYIIILYIIIKTMKNLLRKLVKT